MTPTTTAPARSRRASGTSRRLTPVPSRPMLVAVLEHLVAHGDREKAAEELSQPYSVVMQVAAAHGWPSVERMNAELGRLRQMDAPLSPGARQAGEEPPQVSPLEDLVRAAATSRRPSTRRALRGLLVAGQRLREAVDADREVTAKARGLPAAG